MAATETGRKIAERLNSAEYYDSLRGEAISEVDAMAEIISAELAEREKAVEAAIQALNLISELDPQSDTCGRGAPEVCVNECLGCVARAALSGLGVKL